MGVNWSPLLGRKARRLMMTRAKAGQPGEVLISRVVTDLVAGAGLKFAEPGSQELKGLPGRWDLFVATL
jgi:hypothetical protein